ncbi:butyrophilin subfamily 1 member A1-like isoform X3 [Trachemys scripta elegans]|uniref:butyrophilin subfamily 1 member A1-like isoform X3 n=1 Tax=Trachemys scripta elegans TaxID=31138 RepID=UPI001554C13B|nr:butyrophilin subfamily 1 member A1-like isoform X3 [Trachemys scripta elegans]
MVSKGSSILSLVKSHTQISTITIIGTGTVYLLYRIWKPKEQPQKENEHGELRTQIEQLQKTIEQLQKEIEKAKALEAGASISSSKMFHHWMDIITIINIGTTLFFLWNAKEKAKPSEAEHDEPRTQIEQLQKTIEQLQKEIDQLQTELHQLQNELEWRKARNETDDITLDAGTAHPNLSFAGDKKSLKHEAQPQKVPANPERFDSTVCVLGLIGFSSGKHYWEVDVKQISDWDLGVAKESIQRKGKLSLSPKEGFWALGLSGRDYWAKTDPWTQVTVQKKPQKIGVYLNYQDGRVTFFNVTDRSVLFTFNDCSFSGKVYPFFKNSHKETTMRVCSIKEE